MSARGTLLQSYQWRVLEMGDGEEEMWQKLSFTPMVAMQSFGPENLPRLQSLNGKLVEVV